ncbi:MAG TPA: amidase [Allocoleopsis sp.]
MDRTELAFTPAVEQAQLIRAKTVSPSELVELYLERIQRLDPQLGSYFTVTVEQAIADAKAKTEALAQNNVDELPPFFGVPISIKDLNALLGVRCTFGTPVMKDNIANYEDGAVTRIKQAGFVILGKTATSELGSFPYTEPLGFPPARNPWNLDYTPGGSSGGAAAAVAAGLCAIAQGSDGGGSVRGPAACCGLVGIKPSRGRITHAPVGDRLNGIATNGPLARTVTDAAALLDVMSGYTTGDPYWLPDPSPAFSAVAAQAKATAGEKTPSLRIAFSTAVQPIGEADPVCQQAVLDTVKLLESMGHQVEPGCPDFSGLVEPFTAVWRSGVAASGIPGQYLQPMNRWMLEQSGSCGEYLQAVAMMQTIARRIVAFFNTYDALVLPVFLHPTIRVGEWADLDPATTLQKITNWVAPCPPFNASGQPAIAIPAGFDPQGLPVGVQIVGRPAAESTLIALAAQIEALRPWSDRRPAFAL